ncbi:hypothetical protein BST61_g5115 [Cercospora zeina]
MSSPKDEIAATASELLKHMNLDLHGYTIRQTLWQGYGYVCSVEGISNKGNTQSLILKHVKPPSSRDAESEGHIRKVISYSVEQHFYTVLAPLLPPEIAVAKCHASIGAGGKVALLLEDLRTRFPVAGEKRATLNTVQVHAAIDWLAKFHGFWRSNLSEASKHRLRLPPLEELQRQKAVEDGSEDGVWLNGGYTYLSTRRSELDSLRQDITSEWSRALCGPKANSQPCVAEQVAKLLSPATTTSQSGLGEYLSLIHGDVKSENLFTTVSGEEVAFFDFQYVGLGCGLSDLAKLFTCSVPEGLLHERKGGDGLPNTLPMGQGEKALLDSYRKAFEKASGKSYPWSLFLMHWQTALIDWLRFQASWGFWGNTEWLEARCRSMLVDKEWMDWLSGSYHVMWPTRPYPLPLVARLKYAVWPHVRGLQTQVQQCQQQQSSQLRSASASASDHLDATQPAVDWSEDLYGLLDFDITDIPNFALDTSMYDNDFSTPTLSARESLECTPGQVTATQDQYNRFDLEVDQENTETAAGLCIPGAPDTHSSVTGLSSQSPTSTSNSHTASSSPTSLSLDSRGAAPGSSISGQSQTEPSYKVQKRKRNTEAARRYRQRKEDKVAELEEALKAMTEERNELSLKLARAEAETNVLRSVLKTS